MNKLSTPFVSKVEINIFMIENFFIETINIYI